LGTQDHCYQKVRKKLTKQLRRCRDRDIRVKSEVILCALKLGNVDLACKRLGFGRSFFYKWWNRLVAGKFRLRALREKSRRPKRSPNKIDGYAETRIGFYHRKGYGADMIKEFLRREGLKPVSRSTINHVLNKRQSPTKKRRYKLKKHRRRYELAIPGQRLQIDVKYSPMQVGGKTVYVYVAVDECTRWRFSFAYEELNEQWTVDFLDRLLAACPFPIWTIQTDNGWEFTFKLIPQETRQHLMETWCQKHSIGHRLIPPGVKELNGKVERSHRIDADYFYGQAPTKTIALFNRAMAQWIGFYNVHRPHGGIAYLTPMEKLRERIVALKTEVVSEGLEPIRQRFLAEGPKLTMNQTERQIRAIDLGMDLQEIDKAS
jgi:transposase InsO family protein